VPALRGVGEVLAGTSLGDPEGAAHGAGVERRQLLATGGYQMGHRQVRRGDQVGVLDEEGDQLRIEAGREPGRSLEIRRVHLAGVQRHQHPTPI
jgi:hypothetical protein